MADAATPALFCIITTDTSLVPSGGMAPVLKAKDDKEQQELAMWMSRITNAIVHHLPNGVIFLTVSQSGPSKG
jgi:hypothetical protein